jgi:hypothetical protein
MIMIPPEMARRSMDARVRELRAPRRSILRHMRRKRMNEANVLALLREWLETRNRFGGLITPADVLAKIRELEGW